MSNIPHVVRCFEGLCLNEGGFTQGRIIFCDVSVTSVVDMKGTIEDK